MYFGIQKAKYETAVCLRNKEGQQHPGLYEQEHGQEVKGSAYPFSSALLRPHEQHRIQFLGPKYKAPSSLPPTQGGPQEDKDRLSIMVHGRRMRDNSHKLKPERNRLERRTNLSTERMVKHWNMLPRAAVPSPSLEVLKTGSRPQQPGLTPKLTLQ